MQVVFWKMWMFGKLFSPMRRVLWNGVSRLLRVLLHSPRWWRTNVHHWKPADLQSRQGKHETCRVYQKHLAWYVLQKVTVPGTSTTLKQLTFEHFYFQTLLFNTCRSKTVCNHHWRPQCNRGRTSSFIDSCLRPWTRKSWFYSWHGNEFYQPILHDHWEGRQVWQGVGDHLGKYRWCSGGCWNDSLKMKQIKIWRIFK